MCISNIIVDNYALKNGRKCSCKKTFADGENANIDIIIITRIIVT